MPSTYNEGLLTARRTKESDVQYTPRYAVLPLLEFLPPWETTIWCPFDNDKSEYVKVFREHGHKVIATDIEHGEDFFKYEPLEHYDFIISNPPFSLKDDVLARLIELAHPFAILLPLTSLQGQKRYKSLTNCQALIFDKRISFWQNEDHTQMKTQPAFASIYVCKDFLPKGLEFRTLEEA